MAGLAASVTFKGSFIKGTIFLPVTTFLTQVTANEVSFLQNRSLHLFKQAKSVSWVQALIISKFFLLP